MSTPALKPKPTPCVSLTDDWRLYWGDIHFHSNFSNDVQTVASGLDRPEDCYRYARDISHLDVAVLADHYEPVLNTWTPMRRRGIGLSAEMWEQSKAVTDGMKRARAGSSRSSAMNIERCGGDTNVYFRDRSAPLLPESVDSMSRVWEACRGYEFFHRTAPAHVFASAQDVRPVEMGSRGRPALARTWRSVRADHRSLFRGTGDSSSTDNRPHHPRRRAQEHDRGPQRAVVI